MIINSDFQNTSGIKYKFNKDLSLFINSKIDNKTLESAQLVINYHKPFDLTSTEEIIEKNNYLYFIIGGITGIFLFLCLIVFCIIKKLRSSKEADVYYNEGSPNLIRL